MCRCQMHLAMTRMMMMIRVMEVEMRVMDMVMRGCLGRLSCKGCKVAKQGSEGYCAVEVAASCCRAIATT